MFTQEFFRRASMAALLIVASAVMACGKKVEADRGATSVAGSAAAEGVDGALAAPTLTPETQHALDAGNAAYRAKDYALALSEYEKAAALAPDLSAPWFGIYLVAQAQKDTRAADAALAEIRKRGDAPAMAGATTGTGLRKN